MSIRNQGNDIWIVGAIASAELPDEIESPTLAYVCDITRGHLRGYTREELLEERRWTRGNHSATWYPARDEAVERAQKLAARLRDVPVLVFRLRDPIPGATRLVPVRRGEAVPPLETRFSRETSWAVLGVESYGDAVDVRYLCEVRDDEGALVEREWYAHRADAGGWTHRDDAWRSAQDADNGSNETRTILFEERGSPSPGLVELHSVWIGQGVSTRGHVDMEKLPGEQGGHAAEELPCVGLFMNPVPGGHDLAATRGGGES